MAVYTIISLNRISATTLHKQFLLSPPACTYMDPARICFPSRYCFPKIIWSFVRTIVRGYDGIIMEYRQFWETLAVSGWCLGAFECLYL